MAYLDEKGLAYFKGKLDQITDKLNDQITETDTALDNLTSLIERDTASGSIVEVNAEYVAPVEKLVVNIEPQQDLHGYDNPWPAGGWKNLFDSSVFPASASQTILYIHYEVQNGTYTMSTPDFPIVGGVTNVYFLAGAVSSGASSGSNGVSQSTPITITVTDGHYTVAYRSTNDINTNNPKDFKWQIESGSTATAYAPYSNICPISGWTGAEVMRTGVNLFDKTTVVSGQMDRYGNVVAGTGRSVSDWISIKPNTQYYVANLIPSIDGRGVCFFDRDKNYVAAVNAGSTTRETSGVITTPSNGYYCRLGIYSENLDTASLNYPATATDYEPYTGSQISVTFPASAGTVYGGTLTINPDRTGTLVVNRKLNAYSGGWSMASNGVLYIDGSATDGKMSITNLNSNVYPIGTIVGGTDPAKLYPKTICIQALNGVRFVVYDDTYSTAQEFNDYLSNNPLQIMYSLAAPITYTLTESEVSCILSTIRGTNYIWANTGDIAEFKYKSGGFATTEVAAKMIEKSAGTKADVITETASGSIVSFSDGADNLPVKSLTVNIEPQQDLHGYDAPWPGGGGKNKVLVKYPGRTNNGVTFTTNSDGTISLSGTATDATYFAHNYGFDTQYMTLLPAGTYTLSGTLSDNVRVYGTIWQTDGTYIKTITQDLGTGSTFTIDVPCWFSPQIVVSSGTNTNGLVVKFQVEEGSIKTTFAPYSNICPISGWTGAEIQRTGKNLLDVTKSRAFVHGGTNEQGGIRFTYDSSDCSFILNGTATQTVFLNLTFDAGANSAMPTYGLVGKTITLTCDGITGTDVIYLQAFRDDGTYFHFGTFGNNTGSKAFEVTSEMAGFRIYYQIAAGTTHTDTVIKPMLRLASDTDATYEPYQSNQLSVTFPSSAGTVYGGTLTINPDRTGTLVVDRSIDDVDSATNIIRNASSSYYLIASASPRIKITTVAEATILSNKYKSELSANRAICFLNPGGNIRFNTAGEYNSVEEMFTAEGPFQFVYPLATPITYQLTESEISAILTTLYGTNNIWSDAGDITVEYPVDTKLYIQQLTKPTEDDMTADNAIAAGTFFMIGNTLYLATSQIAAGATITPGTNATKLSLADALNQLNS